MNENGHAIFSPSNKLASKCQASVVYGKLSSLKKQQSDELELLGNGDIDKIRQYYDYLNDQRKPAEIGVQLHKMFDTFMNNKMTAASYEIDLMSITDDAFVVSQMINKSYEYKKQLNDADFVVSEKLFYELGLASYGRNDNGYVKDGTLTIADLKTGRVFVEADDQLARYAIAIIEFLKVNFPDVHQTINSIRLLTINIHFDNVESTLTLCELNKRRTSYIETFKSMYDVSNGIKAVAGRHCDDLYCEGKAQCKSYKKRLAGELEAVELMLDANDDDTDYNELFDRHADLTSKITRLKKDMINGKLHRKKVQFKRTVSYEPAATPHGELVIADLMVEGKKGMRLRSRTELKQVLADYPSCLALLLDKSIKADELKEKLELEIDKLLIPKTSIMLKRKPVTNKVTREVVGKSCFKEKVSYTL